MVAGAPAARRRVGVPAPLRARRGVNAVGPSIHAATGGDLERAFVPRGHRRAGSSSLVFGLVGGWLLAGRMLAPLTRITNATRLASNGSLSLPDPAGGPRSTSSASSPTPSTPCSRGSRRTSPSSSGSPPTPRTSCAPRSRSPRPSSTSPATIPSRGTGELVEQLHAVNARAIDLTEALLLLSRSRPAILHPRAASTCPSPRRRPTETLLPLAEARVVTLSTSPATSRPTLGSHALLLQLTTNLVHNAIVHNLPSGGHGVGHHLSSTRATVVLVVENTGERS